MNSLPRSITATLTASAIALILLVPPASATFPGRNGLIAYSVGGGEEDNIVRTVNADGTRDRVLIRPKVTRWPLPYPRGLSGPQWSPDGKRLLLGGHHHYDRGAQSLWYSNASGKRVTRIPLRLGGVGKGPNAAYLSGWSWAPNGRRVVLAAARAAGESPTIYTIAVDGTHRRALRQGSWPEWSSDGRHIGFSRIAFGRAPDYVGRREIFVMRSDGSGLGRLTTSTRDTLPTFSPDGRHVLFVRAFDGLPVPRAEWRQEWRIVDVTGREDSLLSTHSFWADRDQSVLAPRYCAPQWSPDGERIGAFRADHVGVDAWTGAFVTLDPSGEGERTAFFDPHLPTYCGFVRDFSWQPQQ